MVTHLARILAQQRRAEDTLGGRRLLPSVLTQIKVIDGLARDARGPVRTELLGVASHYNQFAGWMYQDAADTAGALRHYDAAMEAAQIIDDADMVTSVLSRKSHLAWSVGDPARAVGLAQAGQRQPHRVSDAVLALIAQQEARGHALDGAADATERALDHAAALTYTAAEHPEQAPPWVYFQLALALAGTGDADAALVQAVYAAELAAQTGSALATQQLRRVRDALLDSGAEKQAQALSAAVVRTVLPPSPRTLRT